nr:retrovirus-related Pol polyprotein from transposon TNT 1-94 [Tanacetum cinerariifolium]
MGYDQEMVLKTKDWVKRLNPESKLPNFNTGRILVPESQAVNESPETLNTPESPKDSEAEFLTPLPPLKNLQGASLSLEIRGGILAESSQSNESSIGVKCNTCGSTIHSTTNHNELDDFKREDDPSRQYQVDYYVSYYIIPHGHSLTELTQENHVPEVITPNEPKIPHTDDTEGPPDLINNEGTHKQNIQNDQMITQPTDAPLGNNTKGSGSITEPLVPDVTQSHISNQASTSSYPAPHNRWSRGQHIKLVNIIGNPGEGMLTRSMVAKLTAASTSECLFIDFPSKIEPKKVSEALKHLGWIDAMMEAIKIFLAFATYMNFKVYQIDVKSVFLNGKLKEEVYVKKPLGFKSSEFPDNFCKLDKALYGQKQAPKACSSVKTLMVPPNNLGPD